MTKGRENGHGVKPCIQVRYVSERAAPFFEVVFDDTLVELVENVRGNANENVGVGELGPEGQEDWVQALSNKLGWVLVGGLCMESLSCLCLVAQRTLKICPSLIRWHQALRAPIFSATCHQTLLGVVADEHCKYREDSANIAVRTDHFNSISTCIHERLKEELHAIMKESIACN